ncbi:MAG: transposase [Flavobacteriales bacterium]|jgi:transposase
MAKLGRDTRLIPAQYVTPFVMGKKNDPNDPFAITEASQRHHIRFVLIKTELQQEISFLQRVRDRLSKTKWH